MSASLRPQNSQLTVAGAQLIVARLWNLLAIHIGAVCRVEVDDKRLDLGLLVAKLVALGDLAELDGGMLLRAAGVRDGNVGHDGVAAHEVAALAVDVDEVWLVSFGSSQSQASLAVLTDLLVSLEDVQPPVLNRLARLGRLVVLHRHALDRVGLLGEQARVAKVGLDGGRRAGDLPCVLTTASKQKRAAHDTTHLATGVLVKPLPVSITLLLAVSCRVPFIPPARAVGVIATPVCAIAAVAITVTTVTVSSVTTFTTVSALALTIRRAAPG